jgi:hypothetical protein
MKKSRPSTQDLVKNEFMDIAVRNQPYEVLGAASYVVLVAISMRNDTLPDAVDELRELMPALETALRHVFPRVLDGKLEATRRAREKKARCPTHTSIRPRSTT